MLRKLMGLMIFCVLLVSCAGKNPPEELPQSTPTLPVGADEGILPTPSLVTKVGSLGKMEADRQIVASLCVDGVYYHIIGGRGAELLSLAESFLSSLVISADGYLYSPEEGTFKFDIIDYRVLYWEGGL